MEIFHIVGFRAAGDEERFEPYKLVSVPLGSETLRVAVHGAANDDDAIGSAVGYLQVNRESLFAANPSSPGLSYLNSLTEWAHEWDRMQECATVDDSVQEEPPKRSVKL